MAAFLSFESQAQKVSDWIPYLDECRKVRFVDPSSGKTVRQGVEVRPPDVNLSNADFAVVYGDDEEHTAHAGHIRFGLKAIKGAGAKAIDAIIGERDQGSGIGDQAEEDKAEKADGKREPYKSLYDFCERVPAGTVNKATIESLVKSGSFDSVHDRDLRNAMINTIEPAVNAGQRAAKDKAAGQSQLFGGFGGGEDSPESEEPPLAKIEPWSESETLRQEKDTLGFYVSSHPLEEWRAWAEVFAHDRVGRLGAKKQDDRIRVAALVQSARTIVVRNGRSAGQKMAILTIEDLTGTAEAVLFTEAYGKFCHLIEDDEPKFILGRLDLSRGDPQIIVDRISPIDGIPLEKGRVTIRLSAERLNGGAEAAVAELKTVLGEHAVNGRKELARPFDVMLETPEAVVTLKPKSDRQVALDRSLVEAVVAVAGPESVWLLGGVTVEAEKRKKW